MTLEAIDLPELFGPRNTLALLLLIVPCSMGPTSLGLISVHSILGSVW